MDHGTRRAYQRGCRCISCRVANAAYARRPVPAAWTDAAEARAHLQRLARCGVGVRQAARLSGLSIAHVQRIRNGQQRRVKVTTARTVLALRACLADGQRVNSYQTRDALRRLRLEGFDPFDLGAWLGRPIETIGARGTTVRVRTALLVRTLYRKLTGDDAVFHR